MNPFRLWLAGKVLGRPIIERVEHWKLVHTEVCMFTFTDRFSAPHKGEVHIFYYESNLGHRKYELGTNLSVVPKGHLESNHQHWEFYLTELKPWMAGRYVPNIPAYSEVDSIDLVQKLSIE